MAIIGRRQYMYKVSAVITTHNRANLVVNAINSVLTQTYEDFELLIVDDASEDDTEEAIKAIVDNRIRYIKIPPDESKGGNYARNLGVKESKGELIAFLDDDDEWLPDKLARQLEIFAKNEKIGLVYSGALHINVKDRNVVKFIPSRRGDISREILLKNVIGGGTSSIIVKKEKLEEAGLFDIFLPACQEYDMYIRLCQICEVDFTKDLLVNYYIRTNITRIGCDVNKYEKAYEIIEKKYSYLMQNLDYESRNEREINICKTIIHFSIINGNLDKIAVNYKKILSIRFDLKIFIKLILSYIGIYDFSKFTHFIRVLQK